MVKLTIPEVKDKNMEKANHDNLVNKKNVEELKKESETVLAKIDE